MGKKIEDKSPWLPIASERVYASDDITEGYLKIKGLEDENGKIIGVLTTPRVSQPAETYIGWKSLLIGSLLVALFVIFFLWLLRLFYPNFLQSPVTNIYTLTGITANQSPITSEENYKIYTGAENRAYVFNVDKTNNRLLNSLGTEICTSSINSCSNFSSVDKPFCDYNEKANAVCGIFQVIIASGQTIPFTNTIKLNALYNNQNSFISGIYEGEKKWAKQNTYIGNIVLPEITPKNQGEPIVKITFEVDKNGKLTVIASDYSDPTRLFEEPFQIREIGRSLLPKDSTVSD